MTGNFNIRDSDWDPLVHYHSIYTDDLLTIANSLGLELSSPSNPGSTRFADNSHDSYSVLDLVFIPPDNLGFGKQILHPEIQRPSDHVPITVEVGIHGTNIDINRWSIKKDSEEEKNFISSIITDVKNLDMLNIRTKDGLENSVQQLKTTFDHAWINNLKLKRITKHSKEWWNMECSDSLNRYQTSGNIQHWKEFKTNVYLAKRIFFDEKIQEIAMSNKRPWDLMNWVKKKSLPAVEAISYEGCPCNSLSDL